MISEHACFAFKLFLYYNRPPIAVSSLYIDSISNLIPYFSLFSCFFHRILPKGKDNTLALIKISQKIYEILFSD